MDFYSKAPIWERKNQCPNSTKLAVPVEPMQVKKARVITVTNAKFRGSTFSGTFLLGDQVLILDGKNKSTRIEVLCRWFDRRLKTRGLAITVNLKKAVVSENYTGKVYTNFSKITKPIPLRP